MVYVKRSGFGSRMQDTGFERLTLTKESLVGLRFRCLELRVQG